MSMFFCLYFQYYEIHANMENITVDLGFDKNVSGYPSTRLTQFSRTYAGVHGYVSLCVCLFGIVTNLFNVSGEFISLTSTAIHRSFRNCVNK